jgi:hypothetical protein
MDFDNDIKIILYDHFPTVIIDMILLYMGKFNLQFIESVNICTYDFIKTIFDKPNGSRTSAKRQASVGRGLNNPENLPSTSIKICSDNWDIINEKIISVTRYYENKCTLFDMKTAQIIKELHWDEHYGRYCASDGKYIVFKYSNKISVLDIKKMNIICTIEPEHQVTFEIAIINNVIYITKNNIPEILKFKISGEYYNRISFKKDFPQNTWVHSRVRIIGNEIVITRDETILFYDLDGHKLGESVINQHTQNRPFVTPNYVCIRQDRIFYKYKRVL